MKLIQLTDLHIGKEGENTYGVDVRQNLADLLNAIRKLEPDHLIISGDLCYNEGEAEIYKWIKDRVELIGVPFDVIPGNHDNAIVMAGVFRQQSLLVGEELFYKKLFGSHTFLFLDTTKGIVSDRQLAWLSDHLDSHHGQLFIFMHHPPILSGVPHMDENYSLKNGEDLQRLFFNYAGNITIFTGHYHVEKTIQQKNMLVQITPSAFFQMDQTSPTFNVDHYRIGFREITLLDDYWYSTVYYLEGKKLSNS